MADHPFGHLGCDPRCGYLEYACSDRCFRPAREHPGYVRWWHLAARLRAWGARLADDQPARDKGAWRM